MVPARIAQDLGCYSKPIKAPAIAEAFDLRWTLIWITSEYATVRFAGAAAHSITGFRQPTFDF